MKKQLNQQGLVSIVTTIIIIIIITVVTLSLSAASRRELRQAVDEQLSSQALYAAETGINDAIAKLKTPGAVPPEGVSSCDKTGKDSDDIFKENELSADGIIKYTCVLIDKSPGRIVTDLPKGGMKVYKIQGADLGYLTFNWSGQAEDVASSCTVGDGACLSNNTEWNKLGLLRIRLFNSDFTNSTEVVAYPGRLSGGTSPSTASLNSKGMLYGDCDDGAKICSVKIDGLVSGASYNLQLYGYYKDIEVDIRGFTNSGAPVNFIGAQTTIDSTGAAGDVLRRVKVTVPSYSNISSFPTHILGASDSLCKRFTTNATETKDDDSANCAALPQL